ncbi:MAG: adenosylcobalamin-dependent ribonucleoside-diphosphate reductase [bacterium]
MSRTKFDLEPVLTENAKLIAEKRYLKLDDNLEIEETPREMFIRISRFIASADLDLSDKKKNYQKPSKVYVESLAEKFFEIQANLEFLSGMSLLDRGKEDLVAACYVMPIHDSLESIYGTLANTVVLHRRGAGIGYDFSEIRPEKSLINSTGKEASGPISFMRLYDFSSEIILNRGAVRHAGHMGILRIDHPNIEKFITAKHDYSQLTNFNVSIAITDEFIKALENKTTYNLQFNGKKYQAVPAELILDKIIASIYRSGEPGFIFVDEINRHNPTLHIGKMTSTNQCGEQPLLPYEACNLGSIVLNKFVKVDLLNSNIPVQQKINWERMEYVVRLAVEFLDNTITLAHHLLSEIEKIVKYGNRKVGVGVMGWADLLYLLGIPYDSDQAIKLAERIMKFINDISHQTSEKLGEQKGSFKNFKGSKWDKLGYKTMRNATVTTIAPNGTTSLLADCNGGIEPFYALAYSRKNMETVGENIEMVYMNKYLESKLKEEWLYDQAMMQKISQSGSLMEISEIPEKIKRIFVTSYDISPEWHIRTQAAFQKYTDNAVSKTINLPEKANIEDIKTIFKLAANSHLKGMTIYRNKSRDKQVLNLAK